MNNPEHKEQSRIGAGMIAAMWVLLFILLVVFFSGVLDKQNNPNQNISTRFDSNYREVMLERNRYGHYVTDGFINREPVVFMLDTGATGISVPEHVADRLNLPRGQAMRIQTANGDVKAYMSRLEQAGIGGIELTDIPAMINTGDQGEEVLLGMSFLKHIEFTQRGDTLTLRQYSNR